MVGTYHLWLEMQISQKAKLATPPCHQYSCNLFGKSWRWQMCTHQAREFALECFQRKSMILINGYLGMEEDGGRAVSTLCHWYLIASPHTYEITGALFRCPLTYFRLVLCSHCMLWLIQCLLWGFLTSRKQ